MSGPAFWEVSVKDLDPESQVMLDLFILKNSDVDFSMHDLRDYGIYGESSPARVVFEDPRCQGNWSHDHVCTCAQFDGVRWRFTWR